MQTSITTFLKPKDSTAHARTAVSQSMFPPRKKALLKKDIHKVCPMKKKPKIKQTPKSKSILLEDEDLSSEDDDDWEDMEDFIV